MQVLKRLYLSRANFINFMIIVYQHLVLVSQIAINSHLLKINNLQFNAFNVLTNNHKKHFQSFYVYECEIVDSPIYNCPILTIQILVNSGKLRIVTN